MGNVWRVLAICVFALQEACAFDGKPEGGSGVVLSEVMFLPEKDRPQWVEIVNVGNRNAAIAGWMITDYDGNSFTFPKDTPLLPPGCVAAVVFWEGRGGRPTNDLSFDGDRGIVFYHPCDGGWHPRALNDETDQIGLYSSPEASSTTIVDFVCWGMIPSVDSADPVRAGIWKAEDFVVTKELQRSDGGPEWVRPGMSIGRFSISRTRPKDWHKLPGADASCGRPNPSPRPQFWFSTFRIVGKFPILHWNSTLPYEGFRIQVAGDKGFERLIVDEETKGGSSGEYRIDEGLRWGTYYCRVRGRRSDGRTTEWAEDFFTVDKPPEEVIREHREKGQPGRKE